MSENRNNDAFARTREQMVKLDLRGRDITDEDIIKVMGEIPREEFMPLSYHSQAYSDGPLPIGMGQTISQPYIVALMTQALKLRPDCEVLEIGTGSGYQTAVLSRLVKKVYTIERFNELSETAQAVLARLGFANIEFFIGDGSRGWPGKMRFDRIILTAAIPKISSRRAEGRRLICRSRGRGRQPKAGTRRKKTGRLHRILYLRCAFRKIGWPIRL